MGSALVVVEPEVPAELRVAVQSQAVLGALQRSLCIRAAELREGLREWGFARAATRRTEEMNRDMAKSRELHKTDEQQLLTERSALQADVDQDSVRSRQLRDEQQKLFARTDERRSLLTETQEQVTRLQARSVQSRSALDESARLQDQEAFEFEEAERLIQTRQDQVQHQPAEAAWRSAAAEKLALQSEDQLRKTYIQVDQSKQEFAQFQVAYSALQEAHTNLLAELEAHVGAHKRLKEDHESLNLDLNALAKHYVGLSPDLPGLNLPEATAPVESGTGITAKVDGDPTLPSKPAFMGLQEVHKLFGELP